MVALRSDISAPVDRVESRWSDLRYVRELVPSEVVSMCCRSIAKGSGSKVDVCRRAGADGSASAYYLGLHTCKSVWLCPLCSARISERRALELHESIKAAESQGMVPVLVTLTFAHHRWDKLAELVPAFSKAVGRSHSGREWRAVRERFGVVGSVRALEVTHGYNGWHPHAHELWFLAPGADVEAFTAAYRAQWLRSLAFAGLSGNDAAFHADAAHATVAAYVAKFGREPRWGPGRELAKSPHKVGRSAHRTSWQLLRDARLGDGQARMLWLEYAGVFKGRRQLQWSPGLRAALALPESMSDAEACDTEIAPREVVCTLDAAAWGKVYYHGVEHVPLMMAARGMSGDDILAYVGGLGPPRFGYLPGEGLQEWRARVRAGRGAA